MTYLVAAIVAMTNMCGVVTVDTCRARVVSYVPEGGDEILAAPEAGATGAADDGEFEFVGVNRVGNASTMTLRSKSGRGGKPDAADTVETEVSVCMNDRLTVSRTTRLVATLALSLAIVTGGYGGYKRYKRKKQMYQRKLLQKKLLLQ